MSAIVDGVKYPNKYITMIKALNKLEKDTRENLSKQVFTYKPGEYSQYQLERLIPRRDL